MNPAESPPLHVFSRNRGIAVPCTGNTPIDLSDDQSAWFIEKGEVDVFLMEEKDGVPIAAPQHMMHLGAGRLIIGTTPSHEETTLHLIAKGIQNTTIRHLSLDSLSDIDVTAVAEQIDQWIEEVSNMLARFSSEAGPIDQVISRNPAQAYDPGIVAPRQGVMWISGIMSGSATYLGLLDPAESSPDSAEIFSLLPLARKLWLELAESQQLSVQCTKSVIRNGLTDEALRKFHVLALSIERLNRKLAIADQVNLARDRIANRKTDEDIARHQLFDLHGISEDSEPRSDRTFLHQALERIGQYEGIEFKSPSRGLAREERLGGGALLREILDASGVRFRRVSLKSEDKWWQNSCGAMLAFLQDGECPVALIPDRLGGYSAVDSKTGQKVRVGTGFAKSLQKGAWVFYAPLDSDARRVKDLFALAFRGSGIALAQLFVGGAVGSLLMLIPAVFLGILVDEVIPGGNSGQLYALGAVLTVVAFLAAALQFYQGMMIMRVEARAMTRAESAFMSRLLHLPSRFLQTYSAGELATRSQSFQILREAMQKLVSDGLLSTMYLVAALLVCYFHDPTLGSVAIAVGLFSLVGTIVLGARQITPYMDVIGSVQKLAGQVFQLISGISTLILEGAHGSAFAVWARSYRERHQAEFRHNRIESHVQAFGAAMPLIGIACLLLAFVVSAPENLTTGKFLVVTVLFLIFQNSVRSFANSFDLIAAILASTKLIAPLIQEKPETITESEPVDSLSGDIRIEHVSFRYSHDSPLIVDDLSMQIRPNEFVAITGESGSGKSTLLKLLLGIESPVSGSVYYDGRDLRHLNLKQVRRRIGVVPQSVQVYPEDLWDNIAGKQIDIEAKRVWEAAELAVIRDEIMAMPMKMSTSVGAGEGTTSGGESQRTMLAGALISRPSIVMLDEATTWLDNGRQAKVMENLDALNTTRIVIAHRLSTLRKADRIYVLEAGRLVEQGSFDELMDREGVFFHLARRQLA